jgi:hypothetical protein
MRQCLSGYQWRRGERGWCEEQLPAEHRGLCTGGAAGPRRGGNDAQIGPYLSFEGGERYDPAGGGDCPACRLYATKVGGCSACRMEVVRTGLISGNIQWADGWYFALPDLAEALGGTLTWNAEQSVYTIAVPEGRCSTCLLRYRGVSAGGLPGMPMTGGAGGEWVLLVPLMVVVVGVCVVRCSGRLRGRW